MHQTSTISVKEARKILGTTANGLSDEAIQRLIEQVDVLTDVVVAHYDGSKTQSSIDITHNEVDNNT